MNYYKDKTNKKNKSAFSLLEVSIVVIIISIAIAAVTSTKNIIDTSRIKAAQSATLSSPVASIKGVYLWVETTLKDSFLATEVIDGTEISQWNNINPFLTEEQENNFQAVSGLEKPKYIEHGIRSLPVVRFEGDGNSSHSSSDDRLQIKQNEAINSNFAIFVVFKTTVEHQIDAESMAIKGTSGQKYLFGAKLGARGYAGMGLSVGTNGIGVYEHTGGYMPSLAVHEGSKAAQFNVTLLEYRDKTPYLYINGKQADTEDSHQTSSKIPFAPFELGSGSYGDFTGDIGEIIIYDRNLKQSEKDDVTNYLMSKWGIK